jgi:hypothetical protein
MATGVGRFPRSLFGQTHSPADSSTVLAVPECADSAKALVVSYFRDLVDDGFAVWTSLENGDIEVKFRTGEVYHLKETVIVRVSLATSDLA